MSSRFKRLLSRVKGAPGKFAGWMGRGFFATKARKVVSSMSETFGNATHDGVVSSGLARSPEHEKFVYMSDIDGTDILDEFKIYVTQLRAENSDSCFPVKVFVNSGVYGMYARTEMIVVLMYGGIPYILPVHRSLEGIDEGDAEFSVKNNSIIAKLYNQNASRVISLGVVEDTVDVPQYVLERAKSAPLFESPDIDRSLVSMAIANGSINTIGSIYLPGGYLYDIYVLSSITARAIRAYRDYEDNTDSGFSGSEVILVGGDPDVVPVGNQIAPNGYVYEVWVPNDARYYYRAKEVVSNGWLPLLGVTVDDGEFEESYSMLLKMLHDLDEEANGPSDEETSPSIMVNPDEDTETDEVPVLIDLPEYLS